MNGIRFECVSPSEEDAKEIMRWRNDPDTLRFSYHHEAKVWEDFFPVFHADYFSHPSLPPLFILVNGERTGFVLFKEVYHPRRTQADISINIAPNFRGKGIGSRALSELQEWMKARGIDDLIAEIRVGNEASKKAFEKAGFQYVETIKHLVSDTGERAEAYQYRLSLTPKNGRSEVFIIAEAGSNWVVNGEVEGLERAKQMIDTAADAGVDAVKFQTFRSRTLYAENAGKSSYLSDAGYAEDIHDILKKSELPYGMISVLAEYCDSRGVEFMSSVFSADDFEAVNPYVARHKLASYELSHIRLIELMANSGKPLIMSTGCSDIDEIAWAVNAFRKNGGTDLTLMQCTAKYPASIECLNLRTIQALKVRFHVATGLSDHSQNPVIAPVAATALGADVIEKHFTLDRTLQGPDHAFSLEPQELRMMVQMIRKTEQALGTGVKTVLPEEQELYEYAKRRLQAIRDIAPSDLLLENRNFAILRPGNSNRGAHPKCISKIEGKKALRTIRAGEGVAPHDVE